MPDPNAQLQLTRHDDVDAFYHFINAPSNRDHIGEFEPWAHVLTPEGAEYRISQLLVGQTFGSLVGYWVMRRSAQGLSWNIAGQITAAHKPDRVVEIGYFLGRDACGQGLATRGAQRPLRMAREFWRPEVLQLSIGPRNLPSQAVARRLQAEPTSVLKIEGSQVYRVWSRDLTEPDDPPPTTLLAA